MRDDESEPRDEDVVLLRGPTEDGEGVSVLRARQGNLETGELRALKQGTPVHGAEVVRLLPRPGSPLLWNVRVDYDARDAAQKPEAQKPEARERECSESGHAGPARVTSRAYRQGWDAIFAKESKDPVLN